jgi:hypothetical protein
MAKKSFEVWLKELDEAVQAKCGMSYQDLPDGPFRDWYEEGKTPKSAAAKLVKMANEE